MKPIIRIENLSKLYHLGVVGTGTLSRDLNRWWARVRGKEDPYLKIGQINDRGTRGASDFVWALKDINLEVMPGEVLGIIGKNGAGKSTLLKILSKVTGPTTGRIDYYGRIGSLLEVGTGFHPELTGRENIFLNGAILGMTKAEVRKKLDEIVDFSGCERYIDTPVKRYSSGMTVRLGFAVAAHLEPEILVVDEVLAVGDAEFQKKAVGKMQEVSKENGRTVLFVSHNMASIKNLCPRSVLLSSGIIIFEGNSEEVINYYIKDHSGDSFGFKPHMNREGNGKFRITDIYFKKVGGDPSNTVILGSFPELILEYECDNSLKGSEIDAYIMIYNIYDESFIRLETSYSTKRLRLNSNTGKISCRFEDKFLLKPGDYYLSFALRQKGITLDRMLKTYFFEVVDDNYFGSGKSVVENIEAKLAIKHNWEVI